MWGTQKAPGRGAGGLEVGGLFAPVAGVRLQPPHVVGPEQPHAPHHLAHLALGSQRPDATGRDPEPPGHLCGIVCQYLFG